MRNALYTLIRDDQQIQSFGVQKVYSVHAADTPTENLFILLRWEITIPAFKLVGNQDLSIWVHSRDADYVLINRILGRVKTLMTQTLHREGTDGIFSQAYWTGDSPDVRDDGWRTYTKSAGFRCNGGQ